MARLLISIPEQELVQIRKTAKSFGLTTFAYVRNSVKASTTRNSNHSENLRAIRALIPTIGEALGRTQNVSPEAVEKLIKHLLERYDKEVR